MHKLIYFIKKIYVPFTFLFIEIFAVYLYATSSPYSHSRLLSINHYLTGWSSTLFVKVVNYFSLEQSNIVLTERIAELESHLDSYKQLHPEPITAEVDLAENLYVAGRIVSNSINKSQNFIVINKGIDDNVRIGMSVLSPEGYAVGYITNCSAKFSIAMSILSTSLRVSARLAADRSMGLAYWEGGDARVFNLTDVSKYAQIEVGDNVEVIDFSEYFPSGTIIGTVESFELNDEQTMYNCKLRLAADLSRIDNVILVDNRDVDEVRRLKKEPYPAPQVDEEN